jgi:hypothetical protein
MKKLLDAGKRYMKSMDFTDMALLKLCLISFGILIGLCIPSKSKKCFGLLMGILFGSTYIPLMGKLFPALKDGMDD